MRRWWSVGFACLLLSLLTASGVAAPRFRAPTEELADPLNFVVLAKVMKHQGSAHVGVVVEAIVRGRSHLDTPGSRDSGRERSATAETLQGPVARAVKVGDAQIVRMSIGAAAQMRKDSRWLLGLSQYVRGPRFPGPAVRVDDDGLRVIDLAGVGEAAFPVDAGLRALLEETPGIYAARPREALGWLLALLRSPEVASRRLAALELLFEPGLDEYLTPEELLAVRRIARNSRRDYAERDFVFQAAARWPTPVGERNWGAATAQALLRTAPLDMKPGATAAVFVDTLLDTLKARGDASDVPVVARLLRTAHSGIALSALEALEALDPARAIAEARAAVDDKSLPAQSRRYFQAFLRRADKPQVTTGTD